MPHRSEQVYNHNLSSVTLNYPCPVNRQRVVSHNRTKRRVAGPVSRITLCLSYPYKFTTHPSDPRWGTGPPWGSRGRRRHFLMLMVDTPGSPSAPARGAVVDVFNVDGGRSRISISTRQGACHRRFLTLIVGAPESPSTLTGGSSSMFLMLMVDALGSPSAPPRGPAVNVF
jgi:hypothetical protein